MKLEVGMYVKLDRCQGIRKIIDYDKECNWFELDCDIDDEYGEYICVIHENDSDILKASFDIIDLIEAGDYVNGYKVTSVGGTFYGRKDKAIYCDYCQNERTKEWIMIYDDEIKSIVTKEQFEAMKYEIK